MSVSPWQVQKDGAEIVVLVDHGVHVGRGVDVGHAVLVDHGVDVGRAVSVGSDMSVDMTVGGGRIIVTVTMAEGDDVGKLTCWVVMASGGSVATLAGSDVGKLVGVEASTRVFVEVGTDCSLAG